MEEEHREDRPWTSRQWAEYREEQEEKDKKLEDESILY